MYMYLSLIELLCYCIGYTSNNDWSTSIIPLDQYQEKLQERRREWKASQPVEPEDRREIDRLTRVLQERKGGLQEERREKEQVRNRLQQQLEGRERQLQQTQQQGQERERQAREQVQDLQRQLQKSQQQLQERDQQVQQRQERERQARKREQDLQRQLQQSRQQLREKETESEQQIQEAREREQDLQRQLQQAQQQLQSRERESQDRERQLQRQVEGGQQREQDLQRQLQEREQQLEEREREFQERERQLEEQIQVAESSWVVNRREIIMTEVVLGKGGWGEVKVAGFRGLKVAAKCLYEVIISPYNIGTFSREMNIASKIRHPNLLQFIGATTEGNPIILTELMPTSLRKELETGGLAYHAILNIGLDVACALNYLHLFKPHPILHRDVSSANVLLQPMGGTWRAKVSDYGTVSLQPLTRTSNPGNPVYSAPESPYPNQHSPAMDVFSYGVLLIEMVACQFPDIGKRVAQIKAIKRPTLKNLIERCLIENYKERPAMSDIIKELNESI